MKAGIVPDLLVSDFDSFNGAVNPSMEILRAVPEKDDTDTLLAPKEAMRRGYDDIMIIGGLGQNRSYAGQYFADGFAAQHGAVCHLIDEHHQIFAIHNDSIMVKRILEVAFCLRCGQRGAERLAERPRASSAGGGSDEYLSDRRQQ